ncbi:MAG: single-stranded-DNA-specific exonuclease RecJ [Limnohabitans sp.]|nr:single-stranded-DNA-specific exonuclease RecJ [Limnohabitans sp.]
MKIKPRDVHPKTVWTLEQHNIHPLLARLYAARGLSSAVDIDKSLSQLLSPDHLLGSQQAGALLADAIVRQRRICIVADYDCDGATACAVAMRGLKLLGASSVQYVVPDRVVDGYGLTPPIAQRVHALGVDLLVTVDNGIASVEGVDESIKLGMQVLITDHHLPGPELPLADVIVNPNQVGCSFVSKSLAGVGVMFYVLIATRAQLRNQNYFSNGNEPKLNSLLPLVALGTVADVVSLDANNRRLVANGLQMIRKGHSQPGIDALLKVAGKDPHRVGSHDFGFSVGPRINAAGRLSDMRMGIECLLTDDHQQAQVLAQQLDAINRERQSIETHMRDSAMKLADAMLDAKESAPPAICVFDPDFHEGVVGIVASRLKDKHHRPTFVFASSTQSTTAQPIIKGSGRSIAGFHLRDALDLMVKRHPQLLLRFGGHAMAAGCTLYKEDLATFEEAFSQVAMEWLDASTLEQMILTDGELDAQWIKPEVAQFLQNEVWGQGFSPPLFNDTVQIVSQRIVGGKHLALKMKLKGHPIDGIWFGRTDSLPSHAHLAFRMEIDHWQGLDRLKLIIEGMADES